LGSFFPWVAGTAGHRASLPLFLSQFAVAAHAHPVITLLQSPFGGIQVGLKPKVRLILVAGGTLDTLSIFLQFGLILNVFSVFKPVVAIAALEFGINVLHMRKIHSRPLPLGEHRLLIQ
jgi:hypothetical protein